MNGHRSARLLRAAVILAVLLCLTVAVGGASARADSTGAATVTASALNMRAEPSTASAIVTCLPRGTVVVVTGESGDWYQVYYNGHSGYMSKSYLSYASSGQTDLGTGTVKGTYVNVRSGPSTAYSVIGQVNTGASFPVTGVSGSFYQIRYGGTTAYISSHYLTLSGSAGGSSAPQSTPAPQSTGVITGNYVRMRSGPGTGYSILGTYNVGTKMTITGQSGDWYAVSYNGRAGYVYKQYLSQSGVTANVTEMSATPAVTTAGVNLREGPSTAYTSKRVLAAGTSVTVNGKSGQWYRVDWNGVTGYIHQDYVTTNVGQPGGSGGSAAGEKLVSEAKKYLGVPYVYGGTSPSGFDCSGFVYYVYRQCGWSITRTATAQNSDGTAVARADLQPGDIVIFYNAAKTSIGHSGIYIGNNQFIHASSGGGRVMISGLSESYYNTRFYSARRVAR